VKLGRRNDKVAIATFEGSTFVGMVASRNGTIFVDCRALWVKSFSYSRRG
jgi:hypothetical protein